MMKTNLLLITVVLFCLVAGCTHEEPRKATKKSVQTSKAKHKPELVQLAEWSGRNIKKTERFVVGDEWVIMWATSPRKGERAGVFQVSLYDSAGQLVDMIADVSGKSIDRRTLYKAGTYHLSIKATQKYVLAVAERRY